MLLFDPENRIVKDTLQGLFRQEGSHKSNEKSSGGGKAQEVDLQLQEFDDVHYRIQRQTGGDSPILLSVELPPDAGEGGLPPGALVALQETFPPEIVTVSVPPPPGGGVLIASVGSHVILSIDVQALPPSEEERDLLATRLASVRAIITGAPLRSAFRTLLQRREGQKKTAETAGLEHLSITEAFEVLSPAVTGAEAGEKGGAKEEKGEAMVLQHRPKEFYYVFPQAEQVTVVFPVHFQEASDAVLAAAFLQEFVEARRVSIAAASSGLSASSSSAPPCSHSWTAPREVPQEGGAHAIKANAGFLSFVIFPHHVDGARLEKVAWTLATFHAYVKYHIKCSKAFMHTRMRRRVDSLIQVLERAKPSRDVAAPPLSSPRLGTHPHRSG
eukprot:TRINITY_DN1534_c0_g1_i3.p1 TRINITY_DN1534_c0_g1~~TRINITY_DN1534_c0_g1_i3.p1  ORF type:complete len:386 (-),score=83.67 TRINITY_DN1534_c0_g1_i3:644-1801(-)